MWGFLAARAAEVGLAAGVVRGAGEGVEDGVESTVGGVGGERECVAGVALVGEDAIEAFRLEVGPYCI